MFARLFAVMCAALLVPSAVLYPQQPEKTLSAEQLQSLVAPVALYPDPLLAQVLAACTYPLEAVEADRWLQANQKLQGEKLVQGAEQQDWEPSIQALVVFPGVLSRISQNLKWSTGLGNAFLSQQDDVLAAIQAMRKTAQLAGNLQSNSQQIVSAESGSIVIEPANPQVIYIPDYNPTVIYGALPYPYPAITYPPPPSAGSAVAAGLISFGAGVALGAAFHDCCGTNGWGWGFNWHGGGITVNNNFFGRYGYATPYRGAAATGAWAHNAYYRGGAPYPNATVAGRFASTTARTPYGAAGAAAIAAPQGTAARSVGDARAQTGPNSPAPRDMGAAQQPKINAFSNSGGAAATRANSNRGASSMRGSIGGGGRRR